MLGESITGSEQVSVDYSTQSATTEEILMNVTNTATEASAKKLQIDTQVNNNNVIPIYCL